ncbi:efflux RND transporter periplasmic adaptor subunit [Pseudomonas fluorescens]|uniref:efflux RND transporter periplasmic adaptor subunit n=1 Tax=Pseudomonas fluorescens TaxID=294 RepID=UPI003F9673AD
MNNDNQSTPESVKKPWSPEKTFVGIMSAGLVVALIWFYLPSSIITTEDAYVEGNIVQVTAQIGGTVIKISADNTDHVQTGQQLIQLNNVDQEVNFERAKAKLAKATREVRIQYAQVKQIQAEVDIRASDVAKAKADLERRSRLVSTGAVSREEISHAQDSFNSATAALSAVEEQLTQRQAMVEGTQLRSHPDVLAAASNLKDSYIALKRTLIVSPVDGAVTKRNVQIGQHISQGASLMSVVPLDKVWVNANFKESQLKNLRIGQPVTLTADIYGRDISYKGHIEGLDAGTGSAFALLPAQNATGNWIKITQRVPVRIALDRNEIEKNPLRLGLSMHVSVDSSMGDGPVISSGVSPDNIYSTDVFNSELHDAADIVEAVIKANEGTGLKSVSRR